MALALGYGSRGTGRTWPNPFVGCLIVKNGTLVGRGRTADGGRPHAESVALTQAAGLARGATAYVSLEPCTGHSRACSTLLKEAGIQRVVAAVEDPNPKMQGRGLADLREGGIEVTCGCLELDARREHQGFFLRFKKNRPMVTLKMGTSFDGATALSTGESRWITCNDARRRVHLMRSRHDAVLVGSGTAASDNPTLTVRDLGIDRSPIRIICDSNAALSCESRLMRTVSTTPVWICHTDKAPAANLEKLLALGAVTIGCASDESGHVDLPDALTQLANRGISRVLCEGGPKLAASLLEKHFVDNLVGFTAGSILGGDAISAVAALRLRNLEMSPKFMLDKMERVGNCVFHSWKRQE